MKFRLVRLTRPTQVQERDWIGNTILRTQATMSVWQHGYAEGAERPEMISVYLSEKGWVAINSRDGREITDRMPQESWEGMHTQAMAAYVLLGRVPDLTREII